MRALLLHEWYAMNPTKVPAEVDLKRTSRDIPLFGRRLWLLPIAIPFVAVIHAAMTYIIFFADFTH